MATITEWCRTGQHSACTTPACSCRIGTHTVFHDTPVYNALTEADLDGPDPLIPRPKGRR
jgi:hypothetical protein